MRIPRVLWLAVALVLAASPLRAQQGTSEIRGRVVDESGAAVPGAAIVLTHQDTGMYRQVVSGSDGTYFLAGLTPGSYELTAELSGFKKYSRRDVRLEIGKTASLDLRLEVGSLQEQLSVTAEAPIVDVTSKEVGGNITSRELTDLPSINRNYIGFIGLLPGVVPNVSTESFGSDSVSVNGQDARNNNYLLDGANNNDDVIGQRAGTQARTPLEAIQEFQVLVNQFDAEFGRSTGAVINAVTKQGGNAFHGSAFAFAQDASLTEKDYFTKKNNLDKPDTTFQQYGFTLGGPVVRNRAHFFASLERVIIDDARQINILSRPDLNAAPTTETRVWNSLVRFDHQLNANHTWNVRWLREHSPQFNQIIKPNAATEVSLAASREEDDLDQTVVGSFNSTLGNTRFNTFRVTFTQEDVSFANPGFNGNGHRQDLLEPTLSFRTYLDQQSAVAQARVNNAYQIEDTFSWFVPGARGDHNVRFGVQYQRSTQTSDTQDNMNGTFTFATDRPFNASDPSTYPERLSIRVPGSSIVDMEADYFGAFVQDKWKISNRLTLSLGVRYDVENIPIDEASNPFFNGSSDHPTDKNNIAPRLGFAYDPRGDGRMVVRGGYGRFYDKTHFELITAILTAGFFSDSFVANFPTNAADPGPSQGRLPTDPFLVNGPTVDRALLATRFPTGSTLRNGGTIVLDSPDRTVPYTDQFTVGFERELMRNFSFSADYVHAEGREQFMSLEVNPGVRVDTSRTGRVERTDSRFPASALQRVNTGEIKYDAVQLQAERRWANNYRFRVSYTWADSRGNTSGAGIPTSDLQVLNDMNLDDNEGPTNVDRRHNFVVSGSAFVPGTRLSVGTVVRALSGGPFTIQDTNFDPNRNGILFDPIAAGTYSGNGADSITVDNEGGRNGARGPGFFQVDVRLGYQFRFGERHLELVGEVYNLTNRANFDNPTGDRRQATFLVLTALRPGGIPRTAQLGLKFVF
jgi:hypothetical protein